uniref:(California timema) hypothetical protein n=1 Tax=Timema californicum TaxID=61474 RepID=A0A7R9IX10_TIMCA|nr:unnamed protein product [Timema californicum]
MKDDTGSKSEAIQPLTEQTHNKTVGVAPVDPRLGNITSSPIGSQGFDRAQGNIGFASPPLGLPAHSNRDPRSYIQQTTSLPNKQFCPLPQQFKQSTALSTNISLGSQQSFPMSNNVPSICPLVPSQTTLNNTLPLCMPLVSQPNSFQSPLLPQPMPQYYDYNHSSTRDPRAAAGNRVGLMPDKFTNSSVSFFHDNIVSPQYPTDVNNSGILQSPRQHFDDHVGPKTDLSMSNYQYPQPLLNNKPCHPTGWSDVSHNAHHYQGSSGYTAPNAYNSNFGHQMGTINNVRPMFQTERHFGQNPYRYVKPGVRPVSHVDNTLLRTVRRESIHSKPYTPCTYSEWKRSKQNADLPDDKRRYPNDRIHTRSPPRSSRSPPRRPKSPPRRPRSPPKTSTASVKLDSDSKQDGCSSDDLNSPLNSLYGAVIAAKTGRGYGPQKFKIPKRPQEPLPNKQKTQASSDEVPQSNVTDSEDASNKSVTESEAQEGIGEKKLLEELVGDDGKMMNSLQEFIFTGLLKNYSKKMLAEKNIEANESTLDKMVKKLLEASDESDVSKHLKKPIKRIIDSDSDDDCSSSARDIHLSKETKVEELVHSKRYKKRIVENISSDSECSDASSSKVESTKLKSNIIDDFDNLTKSKQTSTCTIDKYDSDDENILLTHRLKRQKPGKDDSPTRALDNRRLSDFKTQNVTMSCNAETSHIDKSAIRITKKKRKIIMSDEESDFSEYNEVSLDKQIEDGEMVSSGKSMIKVKGKKTKLCVGVKDKNSSEFTVFSSPQHIDDLDITLDEETPILKKSRRKEDGLPDTESVMTELYTGERIQGDESDITRNIKTTKRGRAKKKQIKKLNKGITAVGSELNDDALETTSESSDIHPTRKKFKKRNSLELLQEDVKDMFISDDVLTANGYRTCRLSKEILDEMRSEKVSKVEVDEINSFTEKLPQVKVKAKYKSKKVKKIETGDEGNVSSGETDSSCLTSKDFDSSLELGIKVKDKSKKKSVVTKANKKTLTEKAKSPRKKKKLSLKNENNIDEANLRAPMVVLRRTDISKCGQEWATKTNMSGRNVARRGRKRGGIHLRGKIIARRPFYKPKSGSHGTTDFFENHAPDTNVAEDTLTEADKFCYFVRPKKWLKPKSLGKSVVDIINKLYQKFGESCPDINSLNALCLELSEKMRTNSIMKTQTFEKIETAIQEDMVVSCKSIESQDHLPIIKGANIVDKVVTDESSNVCSDTGTKKPKQKKTPNRKTSVIKLKKPVGKKRRKHWQQGVIKAPNKLKRKNKLVDDVIKKNKRTAKQKSDDVTCDPPLEHKHFKGENKTRDDLSVEKNDPGKVTTNTKLDENIFSHKTINEASLFEDSHGSDLSKHVTSDSALDDLVTKCTAKSVDSTFKEIEGVNPETIELISDTPREVDLKTKLTNNLFKRTELTSKSGEIKNVTEVDELVKNKTESAHDLVKKANGSNLSKTSDLTSDTLPIVHTTKPTDDLFKETNGSILSNSRDANSMAHSNIDLNPILTTSESENFDLGTRTQHSVTEATSSEQLSLLKEIPNKLVKKSSNEAFETVFSTSQYNGLSIISERDQPSLPEFAFGQGIKENSNSIISLIEKSVSNWETKSSTIVDQDPLKSSSLSSLETSVSDSFDDHTKSKTRSAQNHKLTKQLINNLNKPGKLKGSTFAKKSNKKFISEKSELSGTLETVAPMGELNTESSVFISQKTDEVCSEAEKSNSSAVLLCKDSLNRSGLNSVISWLLEGQEKIHTLEKSTNEDETALFVNIPTVTYNTRHKKIANKSELLKDNRRTLNFQNAEYANATAIDKNRNKSSCISDELPENVVNKVESTPLPSNLGENLDDSIPAQNSNKDFTAPLSHPSQNFTVPVTQPSQDVTLPLAYPSQDVTVLVPHQSQDVAVPVAHTSQEIIAPIAHPFQDISVPLAHSNQAVSDPLTLSSPNEDIDVTHCAPVFRIRVKRLPGDMLSFAKDSLPTPVDINETSNENIEDTDVDVEGLTIDEEAFSPAQVSLDCSDSVFSEQDLRQEPAETFTKFLQQLESSKVVLSGVCGAASPQFKLFIKEVSPNPSMFKDFDRNTHRLDSFFPESELTSPSKEIFDHSYARPTFSLTDGEIVAVENTFLLKQSSTTRPSLLKLNPPVGVAAASTSKSACTVNKATLSEKVGGAGNQRRKLQHKSSQAPSYSKSQKMPEVYNIMLEPRKLRHLYKCMGQTCSYTTNVTKNYIAHCKEHEEMRKKPLRKQKGIDWRQCAYCCVNLKTVDELNTSHTGEQLAITMCKVVKNISERIDLIKERNEVVLPYICKQGTCNERFYIHKDFYNHLTRQHSQLTMYSCHLCESTSFKPDTLMTHYKLHSYCFYQCMYCVHGGDTKEDMHHHLCNFHPNQPSTVLVRLFQTKDQSSAKNQVEDLITIDLDQEVVFNGMLLMPTPGPIETDEDSEDENDMLNSPTELAHNSDSSTIVFADQSDSSDSPEISTSLVQKSNTLNKINTIGLTRIQNSKIISVGNNPVDGSVFKKQNINKAWKTSSANNKQLKKNTLVIPNNTPEVPFDYKNVDLAEIARTGLTGLDLYLCGNVGCTYAGPTAANLKDHIYICDFARDSRNLVCKHCRRGFKQTHTLVEHVRSHGTKRFGCWMCPYRASTVQNMDRHIKHQHKAKQTECFPLNPLKTDIETALSSGTSSSIPVDLSNPQPQVSSLLLWLPCSSVLGSSIRSVKQPMRTSSFSNSSTTNVSKTSYGPNDVHQLPMNAIFPQPISCAVCQFSTKVRVNLVRHLELHSSSNLSVAAVPSDCPVNPVPCLDKKELMFDKMVNLAASSHLRGEHKSDNTLSQEDEAKIPKYIPEHMRYVCGVTNCKYMACDETMLRYHIRALHCDEMSYKCPHCEEHVLDKTKVAVSIERLTNMLISSSCSLREDYHQKKVYLKTDKRPPHYSFIGHNRLSKPMGKQN